MRLLKFENTNSRRLYDLSPGQSVAPPGDGK